MGAFNLSHGSGGFAADPPPGHATGEILANRFRIDRYIARGGMGEVYQAADLHLHGSPLALKTLLPSLIHDPLARQRFEREVLVAREIHHPNVCPTYDLFRAEGSSGAFLFLTMKLLSGEPLSEILKRRGRMSPNDALPLLRQMAAGLDAAHAAGVVHRDFKPGNVMVDESKGPPQAVITDFGISRLFAAPGTVSLTSHIVGTPGFVAPEIFVGAQPSPASDIFSLGVVIREMVTDPPDPAWAHAIRRCLDVDPRQRPASALGAIASLEQLALVLHRPPPPPPPPLIHRRNFVIGVLPAASALTAAVGLWFGWPRIESLLYPLPGRRLVALMPWPTNDDPQSRGLLRNVLAAVESSLVQAEARVNDFLIISNSNSQMAEVVERPADAPRKLGANIVLAASLRNPPARYELTLQVLDAGALRVLRSGTVQAAESALGSLFDGACALAGRLLEVPTVFAASLDTDELAALSESGRQTFLKAEDLAERPNDTGLDDAISQYQKLLDSSQTFSLGYARLAEAYSRKFRLGRDTAELRLARRNSDLARQYNPASSEAQFSTALVLIDEGKPGEAVDLLNVLQRSEAANARYAEHKGLALRHLGRRAEEQAVYRDILRIRPNYWPAYNELGWALYRESRYDEAAMAFAEAAAVAPKVALPMANLGTMFLIAGRKAEAVEAFERSIDREPNDVAYDNLGNLEFEQRHYHKALEQYSRARDLHSKNDMAWRNVADCQAALNNAAAAKNAYGKAAEIVNERLRLNPRLGPDWMVLAFYRAKSGDRSGADAALRSGTQFNATDVVSQFFKAQTLAVLGRQQEALTLVVQLLQRGLSPAEAELAVDLERVRADPRYKRLVERKFK